MDLCWTLAAAYASADRIADAVRYERQAIEAAPELAELFEKRLALYQQCQPYHGQQAPAVRAASYTSPAESARGRRSEIAGLR